MAAYTAVKTFEERMLATLDMLALELTNNNHQWSSELRQCYENAVEECKQRNQQAADTKVETANSAALISKLIAHKKLEEAPDKIDFAYCKHYIWEFGIDKDHTATLFMSEDDYNALPQERAANSASAKIALLLEKCIADLQTRPFAGKDRCINRLKSCIAQLRT